MIKLHNFIIFFVVLAFKLIVNADGQEGNLSESIHWTSLLKSVDPSNGQIRQLLHFEKACFVDPTVMLPYYEGKVRLNPEDNKKYEIILTQTYFEEVPASEVATASFLNNIDDSVKIGYSIVKEKKISYLRYSFVPLRKNAASGKIERLKFFSLKIRETTSDNFLKSSASKLESSAGVFANESVLNSGDWFKFQVSKSGVYKITYNDLKNLGLQNPEYVRIYGNGGRILPEVYSGNVPDDICEIPIVMMSGTDGIFNENDYIIFYAEGPVTWSYNYAQKTFSFKKHEFCENINYFITSAPGGKRVAAFDPPTGDVSTQVNTFDGLGYHEENLNNLIQSGRTWYGEDFKMNSSYDFSFSFPGLVTTEAVKIEAEVLGRSESRNYFLFEQNNQPIGSVPVNPVTGGTLSDYAIVSHFNNQFLSASDNITIRVSHDKNGQSGAEGWLSYISLFVRQDIAMHTDQFSFRDSRSLGTGNIALYTISNANSNLQVWDITDLHNTKQIVLDNFSFKAKTDSLHEYIAFYPGNTLLTPMFLEENHGKVTNQNLHAQNNIDLVIISHSNFLTQAQELADLHVQHDGLSTLVVTPEQIYNEFSSGNPDPAAIRNFMKKLYDNAASPDKLPKYLLLFGDGSYDNKTPVSANTKNTNFIITYQSINSLSPTYSYVSDDYFGLLDNDETINTGLLDIGIGRIPVQTAEQAEQVIKKIKKYIDRKNLGDWRNNICFIADDEDNNLHMEQADLLATYVSNNYKSFNVEKIYLDAYQQISTSTGQRYPDVTTTILSKLNKGALVMNYTGHGGELGITAEQVLTISDIEEWQNDQYPLFVTATCEFGRYDNYQQTSAGETVFLNPNGGGIGLLTTTRVVYSPQNFDINMAFYKNAFVKADDNPSFRLGDIVRKTKNGTGSDINKLCFTLLGDPALSLAYPMCNSVVTDSVNQIPAGQIDTLSAYGLVNICGHIVNSLGQKDNDFNGILYPTVYDKSKKVSTLSNDNDPVLTFDVQNNMLFNGKVTVKNGEFKFNFIMPRDMDYNFGYGKLSYYAQDSLYDVSGYFTDFIIGGMTTDVSEDNEGPDIKLFMNDTTFKSGGITSEYPTLLARVSDEHGINPGGNSIGHDIMAILDNDIKKNYILNSYFQTDIDNFKKGSVTYKLPKLAPGIHTISFKIWDIFNNSSQAEIKFNVQNESNLKIQRIYNYPNPLIDHTYFFFEHNQNADELNVTIQIFNMTGSKVKELNSIISPGGFTSEPIFWNGCDQSGNKIKRGIYLYRVILRSINGVVTSASQKLVVIE
jgi:hypothetical protein